MKNTIVGLNSKKVQTIKMIAEFRRTNEGIFKTDLQFLHEFVLILGSN